MAAEQGRELKKIDVVPNPGSCRLRPRAGFGASAALTTLPPQWPVSACSEIV
jgi:hypothetical protein